MAEYEFILRNDDAWELNGKPIGKFERNSSPIDYEKATKQQFFFYNIKKDRLQKWAFLAFLAAVAGVLIDVGFAIGKIRVFIPFSESQTIISLGLGMVLKIAGLWLVFKKGFWEQK
jgi:uncharacterized protein (DUF2062 family)